MHLTNRDRAMGMLEQEIREVIPRCDFTTCVHLGVSDFLCSSDDKMLQTAQARAGGGQRGVPSSKPHLLICGPILTDCLGLQLVGSIRGMLEAEQDEYDYHNKVGAYGPGGEYYEGGEGGAGGISQADLQKLRGALS